MITLERPRDAVGNALDFVSPHLAGKALPCRGRAVVEVELKNLFHKAGFVPDYE